MDQIRTIAAIEKLIREKPASGTAGSHSAPSFWFRSPADTAARIEGRTIPECFLNTCRRLRNLPLLADETSGVLSARTALLRSIILAGRLKKEPGKRVGVMLPASVAATLSFVACLLAGKTPAMLNWTAGVYLLSTAEELAGFEVVVTSRRLWERLNLEQNKLKARLFFLEDLKSSVTAFEKLSALLLSYTPSILKKLFAFDSVGPSDAAVLLFTSGSEAKPKCVPLSHHNLLSNGSSGLEAVGISKKDIFLSFLPPFHSFGLLLGVIMPLISGVRVTYYPDPNESAKLVEACRKWGATFFTSAPVFLRGFFSCADKLSLSALRMIIVGADRMPGDLLASIKKVVNVPILEGYGATECSPIISVNRPEEEQTGVGRPLRNVSILIVHPETRQPLEPGLQGLILVSGPNVFSGYIGTAHDPFLHLQGLKWYSTGDLGRLENGKIVLTGRLTRFVKIGGEMVSLPAIEDCFAKKWPITDGSPAFALIGREPSGSRAELVLFTLLPGIKADAFNEVLRESGFSNLIRISKVNHIEKLPILGSGKIDYKKLEKHFPSDT